MRYIKSAVICCLIFIGIIPVRVSADTPTSTYVVLDGCLIYSLTNGNRTYSGSVTYSSNNSEIRATVLNYGQAIALYLVSANSFMYKGSSDNSCAVGTSSPSLKNGYYVARLTQANYGGGFTGNVPVVNDSLSQDNAIKYTFGDGAIAPGEEIPDYGDLILKGYKTDIAGSGNAAVNNKDTISWEPVDSNGNDITNFQVTIRAVPGQYSAASKASLLEKTYSDFVLNTLNATQLGTYPAREQSHAFIWSNVISVLDLPFLSISSMIKRDETWIKNGWIYQIRLEDDENNYIGEWQTVYTGTSAGVQNDLTVINSTTLNQDLINVITSVNNRNEVTNNWTIINIIIIPNPDPTPSPSPEPGTDPGGSSDWFSALLQAIVDLISGILSFLGNLIDDLIDAIVSLFQPAEFTINNFNEYKLELKQNSGIFGQSLDFITTLKNTFTGVQYQDPIIHWQGISFGETEFIPAADYNLNEYVTMWGLGDFRTMAYLCSDGFIYVSLLVLIVRKLNEVLKK